MSMTESEAIEILTSVRDDNNWGGSLTEVFSMAITALEEVQQYRAIGTVEEVKADKVLADKIYDFMKVKENRLKEYEAIGTVSEFRELKEKNEPIKALGGRYSWDCPRCGTFHSTNGKYCSECGQAVELD